MSVPENINAVRIFSIHKSKGLEFPVVLLPFANWPTAPKGTDTKWFDWEDNKEYYLQWKEIIKKVNSDWGVEYYKSKQDEIQHNFELCKKIDNNTLYSSMGELFDEE